MRPEEAILRLEYVSASRLASLTQDESSSVLGGMCFSHPAKVLSKLDLPFLAVDMAMPSSEDALCEIWHSDEPLRSGQLGAIRYRQSETLLFGCMSLDEMAVDVSVDVSREAGSPLQSATETAYQSLFALLEAQGYTSLLRVWNYFSGINAESHHIERYRQFNIGRQEAFLAHGRSVIDGVPAACALGSATGGLNIAFLATRSKVTGIENPRQVSAYHYPDQYGPRTPTFARAGLANLGGRDVLFISGTASIVGHQTLHHGDVAAQTRECLQNIAAVVDEANRQAPHADFQLDRFVFKVYVRNPENLAQVRREIADYFDKPVSAVFLQADICRADLLVEIEASGGHLTPLDQPKSDKPPR